MAVCNPFLLIPLIASLFGCGGGTPTVPSASSPAPSAPSISSIYPTSGPSTGGTSVTIKGSSFQSGASVAFGGVAAAGVTVNSGGTAITAATPAQGDGSVNVEVTNPNGQTAILADAFSYITSSSSGPYTSRTDTDLQLESPLPADLNPPPVNVVFSDPDFGSRMVRVTDGNTPGQAANYSWGTAPDASSNLWSLADSDGNYKFIVSSEGNGALPMSFDPVTMKAAPILSSPYFLSNLIGGGVAWSFTDPNTVYGRGVASNQFKFVKYVFSGHSATNSVVFDTSTCPGVGSLSGSTDLVTITKDDNRLVMAENGGQNQWNYVVLYDQKQGTCRVWNTNTGVISGSLGSLNDPTGVAVAPLAAPGAPSLSTVPGGTLPKRTYYVKMVYVDMIADHVSSTSTPPSPAGESSASLESAISVPAGQLLVVTTPSPATNSTGNLSALGWDVFVAPTSGSETLQNGNGDLQAAIAIGENWTEPPGCSGTCYPGTNILSKGSSPPASDYSVSFGVHAALVTFGGNWVQVNSGPGSWHAFWQTDKLNIVFCYGVECSSGHNVAGYEHWINNQNDQDDMQVLIHQVPPSALGGGVYLLNPVEGIPVRFPSEEGFDNHYSWNNDNSSDTAPIIDAQYHTPASLNNGAANIIIKRAWDEEIIAISTSEPYTVWRFAHHRSNATNGFNSIPIPQVSQDGKFALFSSDWENTLGTEPSGGPGPFRHDVFVVELK